MRVLDARFVAAADRETGLPPPAFAEIAFAGRSNVGKSTLINRLVGRKNLVRTSSTPGCTRTLSLFRVRLRDETGTEGLLDLVDLPGYGYAKRSKTERLSWGPMIEGFLRDRVGLRAVVLIVDVRRGLGEAEQQLLTFLESVDRPAIIVFTKLDKLASSKRRPRLRELQQGAARSALAVSGATGDGLNALWAELMKASYLAPNPKP